MARMRVKPMRRRARNNVEAKMVKAIDDLAEFQEFRTKLLPAIRTSLKDKQTPKEILELARSYAAARIALVMAMDPDNKTALAAAKDLLDRTEGKAIERKEFKHQLSQLKDEELDALLESKLKDVD